ncbi:hypothetical protein PHOSAC3_150077 [Mesotoga infera]|nr:hypothetical protein PHOSAC3_150077 [Mesotoga infera]
MTALVIPKTSHPVMNLFQHLDGPKIRFALKRKNPLVAVKSRPWLFVRIREAGDAR